MNFNNVFLTRFNALLKFSSRCKFRIRLANRSIDAKKIRWICCFSVARNQCINIKISFFYFRQCIRVKITFLFDFIYIQNRQKKFNRVLHSKRLFQYFLMNAFVCVKFNNFNFVRFNQQFLRIEFYRDLMNRLSQNYELNDIDQKMTILLSNHIEFSRYMKIKKQNVFVLIRKFNKFIFFIIFICNSRWKKFTRNLFDVVDIVNRFDLIIKMFQLKFKKILRDFIEHYVIKIMIAHIYVIEFQKKFVTRSYFFHCKFSKWIRWKQYWQRRSCNYIFQKNVWIQRWTQNSLRIDDWSNDSQKLQKNQKKILLWFRE